MTIKQKAEASCFYVENGLQLRIDGYAEDYFCCYDEETGEEYQIEYNDVVEDETTYFLKLEKCQ